MKKHIKRFFCILALLLILPLPARADTGPKPSIVLNFDGLQDSTYYVTLLSEEKNTGPYAMPDDTTDESHWMVQDAVQKGLDGWQAFLDYQDVDGFHFMGFFEQSNDEQTFTWGYYPPEIFKILVYLPEDGTFLVSDVYESYAFDSYFDVTMQTSGDGISLVAERNYDFRGELNSLGARVAITVIVELLLALCFGLTKKKLLFVIVLTNVVTQLILNVLLNGLNVGAASTEFLRNYFWMEMVVFAIEAVVFSLTFKKYGVTNRWLPTGYALVANLCSFVAGLIVMIMIPGIF